MNNDLINEFYSFDPMHWSCIYWLLCSMAEGTSSKLSFLSAIEPKIGYSFGTPDVILEL